MKMSDAEKIKEATKLLQECGAVINGYMWLAKAQGKGLEEIRDELKLLDNIASFLRKTVWSDPKRGV